MKEYDRLAEEIQKFILKSVEEFQKNGILVPLSGGIDSATTLTLVVKAVGRQKVHAAILPCGDLTKEEETEDAIIMAKYLKIGYSVINIAPLLNTCLDLWRSFRDPDISYDGTFISRSRMMISRMFADEMNYLVAGCGNKTETYLGNFVKVGVGLGDIFPIGGLFKTEVIEMAKSINVPERIIDKKPDGGFVGEVTDEQIFGPYEKVDKILYRLEKQRTVREISKELKLSQDFVSFVAEQYKQSAEKISYETFSVSEWFSSRRENYLK